MWFTQSDYDYSLFIKTIDRKLVIILVCVDDLLMTESSQELITQAKKDLQQKFKMKDLGKLKFFLGIEVARSQEGIIMCQRKYVSKLVLSAAIPLEINQRLTSMEYDKYIPNEEASGDEIMKDPIAYQRLVGRLLYLTMSSQLIHALPKEITYGCCIEGCKIHQGYTWCRNLYAY